MKYLLLTLLLTACTGNTEYHSPENGTCLKHGNYGNLVLKHYKDNSYIVLQYDYWKNNTNLYGLGEESFEEYIYEYVECPEFKAISPDTLNYLKNRKLFNHLKTLIK